MARGGLCLFRNDIGLCIFPKNFPLRLLSNLHLLLHKIHLRLLAVEMYTRAHFGLNAKVIEIISIQFQTSL